MTEHEQDFDRRLAARRALIDEADDLFMCICALEGGDAELECTEARAEVFAWVMSLPRFSRAARAAILSGTNSQK
jgi:hypothetical protein